MSKHKILEQLEVFPIEELAGFKISGKSELNLKMALYLVDAFKVFYFGGDMKRATMRVTRALGEVNEIKPLLNRFNSMQNGERLKVIRAFAERQAVVLAQVKIEFWELLKQRIEDRVTVLMPSYYDALIALLNILRNTDTPELMYDNTSIYMAGLVCYMVNEVDERTLTWLHASLMSDLPVPLVPSRNSKEMHKTAEKLLDIITNYFD